MTERELQDAVLELAGYLGWLRAHFRPARTEQGWRTPVSADGAGFPDLVLVRAPRLLFVELKSASGRLRPEQKVWLTTLEGCVYDPLAAPPLPEVYVWRPVDWTAGTIERVLRG